MRRCRARPSTRAVELAGHARAYRRFVTKSIAMVGSFWRWTFALADCGLLCKSVAVPAFDESRLMIEGEDVELSPRMLISPSYWVRRPPFLRSRRQSKPGIYVARFRLRVEHVTSRGH